MALDSTWWATGWVAQRWLHDWSGSSATLDHAGAGWRAYIFDEVLTLYQVGFAWSSMTDNNKNTGYLYAKRDDSEEIGAASLSLGYHDGVGGTVISYDAPDPAPGDYDLQPIMYEGTDAAYNGHYQVPWQRYTSPGDGIILRAVFWRRASLGTADVWHYQPFCYVGYAAEAIAALLRHLGLPTALIDMDSFSDAQDAQSTHTLYGPLDSARPYVYVRRELGETVAETIKRVARHCWDFLAITREGKIAMISRVLPPYYVWQGYAAEGVLGDISWRYAYEHLVNIGYARHAECGLIAGVDKQDVVDALYTYESAWEPEHSSDKKGVLLDGWQHFTSRLTYGDIYLRGKRETVNKDGRELKRIVAHYPYFLEYARKARAVSTRLTREAFPLREVTVRQDMRGLDYGLGHRVLSLAVAGQTVADLRCIRQRIDFDAMTVTSTLLEEKWS